MLVSYKTQYGIDYVTVCMSHTMGLGIGLTDGRAFAESVACVLRGADIALNSDGSAARTYTYTVDAVTAMFLALLAEIEMLQHRERCQPDQHT